ncbi:MAG: matrixin family metalloprotease [Phycisphaerales bacterium]|nr:MAG: matrixin family metalloprotease [Phycisphaerales bacterium]
MRVGNLWMSSACILCLTGMASGAVIYKDVAELTAEAQRIVIGDVVEVSSFWNDNHDVIRTRVVIDVDDYLLGPGTGIEVLEMRGGTVGDITLQLSVLPVFEQGDHVLLFLSGAGTPILRSFQGAYLTDGNLVARMAPACRRVIDNSLQPLTEMLTQIQQALPPGTTLPQIAPYEGNFVLPLGGLRYSLCGQDWTYKANPMGEAFYINPNCADSSAGDPTSQITQIQNGMSSWNNSGADFTFIYGGTSGGTSDVYDNVNLIFFDPNPTLDAVAVNHRWFNGGNITETDISFNDRDYVWWDGSGLCGSKMDIWNVATHELGHSLCLSDLYGGGDSSKTMYGYVSFCDTHARTLHQDDIDGIVAIYGIALIDCNGNGIQDAQDIAGGTSQDCNGNTVPDECDVSYGTSQDCNGDTVPDECQLTGNDCNANGVPDECEPDCNSNTVADECDIIEGTSADCNGDVVPDECQIAGNDCNGNLLPDDCEADCDGNDVPDDCDITGDPGLDGNGNGVPDSCEAEPRLECGVVAVSDSAITVPLNNTYDSPVVVCSVQYDNNMLPVVTRVSNVTPTSFDVRLQNPSGNPVTTDNVSYLVVEEGVTTIDGVEFEAWTYSSTVVDLNLSWVGEPQRHKRNHVNPVVLGQVMTENDPDWSVFWCQGATTADPPSPTTLRTGKHVGSDLDVTRTPETIGIIVTEASHWVIDGVGFEARLGDATVQGVDNTPPYPYLFDTAFATAPTVAVLSQAGMIGSDGSWAQAYGPALATTTTLNLSLDEDQLGDSERLHTPERVAYVVFEAPLVYPSVGDGDFDSDGDVDLDDFGGFQVCFDQPAGGGCQPGDMNGDDFIDAADIAPFVNALIGP